MDYAPRSVCPFCHRWTLALLPSFGRCEKCRCEHGCVIPCPGSAFGSFGSIPRSGIVESYGYFTFNFLRSCHILFLWQLHHLHSLQQCRRVSLSPHPCRHLLFSLGFFLVVILMDVKCYLIVVLMCISLMISDTELLFM